MSKSIAIILAGGSGNRMKGDIPKQFMKIMEKEVLVYSLQAFEKSNVDEIIVVTKEEYFSHIESLVMKYKISKFKDMAISGKERYFSVYSALQKCENTDFVLVHDAARPLISIDKINKVIENLYTEEAIVLAVPVKDTIRQVDELGKFKSSLDRSSLYSIQTPQAFKYSILKEAYDILINDKNLQIGITDDAMVVEKALGIYAQLMEGEYSNIKLTTKEDLDIIKNYLESIN